MKQKIVKKVNPPLQRYVPQRIQTMNVSQRLVIYGLVGGAVITLLSLLAINLSLNEDLFYMGYYVLLVDATAGPSMVSFYGFPLAYASQSAVATMFGYFAFLADFVIWVLVIVAIGEIYQKTVGRSFTPARTIKR